MLKALPLPQLKYDLPASIALVIVAIPLCLGIAHASGAPMMSGLIAGAVGGIVVGLLSESNLSVSGPAAGLTSICLLSIHELGSFDALIAAVLFAGIFQIAFGLLRLGFVSNYIPMAVIKGMLSAIGLMLILKQFPHLVGFDAEEMGAEDFTIDQEELMDPKMVPDPTHENTFSHLMETFAFITPTVAFIGFLSLLVMVVWEKKYQKKYPGLPGSLLAVFAGTLVAMILSATGFSGALTAEHFVNLPDILSEEGRLQIPGLPSLSLLQNTTFLKVAGTIAIVASLESLLSIEAIEKLDPHRHRVDGNRELLAQGMGNLFSALLGGLPVTSVIVRGSVNITAGARTRWSAVFHGILIIASLLFLLPVINSIPLASLAAVLCYTGYKLIQPSGFKEQYQRGWYQFIPFVITIVAIVLTDLLMGVMIGMVISSLFIVRENYHSHILEVHDLGLRWRINLGNNISFLHKRKVIETLESVPGNTILEIDGSRTQFIDPDILDVIRDFAEECKDKNIKLIIGGIAGMDSKEQVKDQIDRTYRKLFENNRKWVENRLQADPEYFQKLTRGQTPEYLFIGCSDSRVPANEITGTDPGEMFVHRNIANMVVNTDINMLSVLQYSVEVLNVKHVIVCGHYGCGGVKAAMEERPLGLIDKWLANIKDVYRLHRTELENIKDPEQQHRKMVELNVREQVFNLMKTSYIQKNRELYGFPQVHGWVYDIAEGYIKDLEIDVDSALNDNDVYRIR